ncbi:UDP-N-acetylglucosamine 2-epimerase [Photobacterium damselae]|uniref:UDP-N-acetylglucosamine 2-epimerase n=1 Tax=Photobacterium damselae TaxID=38293 RepID=UPI000D052360|nr:UDP-N-acetylglucosamine 2-epimerase [Photobacterium damselae]PSB80702.1 UDP-N-acetylglucosamine 2-epimerase (hydrolyzing) [Photobacterium damselae subsp. damselae]
MRKICVVTATRAEYGPLKPLISDLFCDNEVELQLIVTGTHLSPEFGMTIEQIQADNIPIRKTIEILLSSDTPVGIGKSMGLAQISFIEAFDELKPDIVVVLGDRYELIPIVSSANILSIPVAHISGGEKTEGAIDEIIRHAVTKMSSIHFTAMDEYRNRVIQMGEQPKNVFTVGEIGLDNILRLDLLKKDEFEKSINRKLNKHNYLVTYHPETTLSLDDNINSLNEILFSLDQLNQSLFIFTKSNADCGGRQINEILDEYVNKNSNKAVIFDSLGQLRYLSALQYVDAVIGNSSSGICEVPSFKLATINIGERQGGRVRSKSVIDVKAKREDISEALSEIKSEKFSKDILNDLINPYGNGNTSIKIMEILKTIDLKNIQIKTFYDLNNH